LAVATFWGAVDSGAPQPTRADWLAARDHIRQEFRPGDGIRVEPVWMREGASIVAPLDPKTSEPPSTIDLTTPADPYFVVRHKRLWLVSALDRNALPSSWEGVTLQGRTTIGDSLVVSRYGAPTSPIETELLSLLSTANVVRLAPGQPPRQCNWREGTHKCRGRSWEDVRIRFAEVAGSPRRCIVLHPYPDGGTLRLSFDEVPLSNSILLRSGLTLEAARRAEGSDVGVVVTVNGEERLQWQEPRNGWKWADHWVDTQSINGMTATIQIDVTALEEEFRDVCLDGYILSSFVPDEHS
jgi:hypothetical protein